MSLSSVKTYARTRMAALGYTEWTDGFNAANIPQTLLNSRYFIELGDAGPKSVSNDNEEITVPLTVKSFLAPTGNPKGLIDTAAARVDTIVAPFVKASNRVTTSGILNVTFQSSRVLPLGESNDNGVVVEIAFNVLLLVSTI